MKINWKNSLMAFLLAGVSTYGAIPMAFAADDGLPDWVNHPSGLYKKAGGRVIYGVGVAQNISNAGLMRETCDKLAMQELTSTLNTYIDSVNTQYISSVSVNGELEEKQDLKTKLDAYVKSKLVGSRPVDRYISKDGTMYCLYELKLTAMDDMDIAQIFGDGNPLKNVNMDNIFDDMATNLPAAPMARSNSAGVSTSAPISSPKAAASVDNGKAKAGKDEGVTTVKESKAAKSSSKKQKVAKLKNRPDWADGNSARYPDSQYLCGVGVNAEREVAEKAAYNAVSLVFEAHIQGATQVYLTSMYRTGEKAVDTQSVKNLINVSTDKVKSGIEIKEIYTQRKGDTYALACLDRAKESESLREQIAELDKEAAGYFNLSKNADKLKKISLLKQCGETLLKRASLNAELRIVDIMGTGVPAELDYIDVEQARMEALQTLKIAVEVTGEDDEIASDLEQAIIIGMNKLDYEVLDWEETGDAPVELHAIIKAKYRMEELTDGDGRPQFRGIVSFKIDNKDSNKVAIAFDVSKKNGSKTIEEAQRRVVRDMKDMIIKELDKQLKKYTAK